MASTPGGGVVNFVEERLILIQFTLIWLILLFIGLFYHISLDLSIRFFSEISNSYVFFYALAHIMLKEKIPARIKTTTAYA